MAPILSHLTRCESGQAPIGGPLTTYVGLHARAQRGKSMGYFDALTTSSFKTSEDGHRLFFPWGALGRGYRIPSEQDFERLRHKVKVYMMASLPVIIGVSIVAGLGVTVLLLIVLVVAYVLWAHLQCRGMVQVAEKYTISESMASQAREHGSFGLWLIEIGSAAFVAMGIFILIVDPSSWLIAAASILFFGLGTLIFGKMIATRNRQDSRSGN